MHSGSLSCHSWLVTLTLVVLGFTGRPWKTIRNVSFVMPEETVSKCKRRSRTGRLQQHVDGRYFLLPGIDRLLFRVYGTVAWGSREGSLNKVDGEQHDITQAAQTEATVGERG